MNSRAARALSAAVLVLAMLGIVAPANAASSTAGTVALSLTTSDFSAAKPGSPLHLLLTVEDTVGAGIEAGTATVRVSRTPLASRSSVTEWLNGTTKDTAVATTVSKAATSSIDPGQTKLVDVDVAAKSLGFGAAGVYAVSVTLTTGDSTIGGARTAVSWKPSSTNPVPFAIAAPLTLPASSDEFIPAKTLEEATAPDGILTRQLNDLADTPVAIGIDPRIIASIRVLGNTAPQSANDWLDRLSGVTNETFPLAWADADLTVAQQAGSQSVPRVRPLNYAIDPDRFQPAPTTTETPDPGATETTDPGADPGSTDNGDPPLPSGNADLTSWNYTIPQLAWPAPNTVTKSDLTKFGVAGLSSVILSSSNTKRTASGNAVGSASTIGSLHVVTSDEQLSGYLAAATMASTRAASNAATTSLAAALDRIAVASTGDTPMMVATLPRNWDDDGLQLDRVLSDVYARSWVTTASITQVLTANAPTTTVVSKEQSADRVKLVRSMLATERRGARFSSVVEDPEALTSSRRLVLLSILSNEWSGDDAGWTTAANAFVKSGRAIVRSVQVNQSSDVLFLGNSGPLPVKIENSYSQDVTVYLTLHPSTTLLAVDSKYTGLKVEIPAGSQAIARIPAEALSNGKVSVRITLKSVTGRVVGTEKSVTVNVQAGWESIGTLAFGILVIGIFGFGIFRNIRKRLRARRGIAEPDESGGGQPETSAGE